MEFQDSAATQLRASVCVTPQKSEGHHHQMDGYHWLEKALGYTLLPLLLLVVVAVLDVVDLIRANNTALQISAERTKYNIQPRVFTRKHDYRHHSLHTSVENLGTLNCTEMTVRAQNYTQEIVKNTLHSGNACSYSVQILMAFHFSKILRH